MASNTESTERSSFIENLINSRDPDFSLLVPLTLGLNHRNPNQETEHQENSESSRDRVILINPFPRTLVIIENSSNSSSLGFDSLIDELFTRKSGQPPASKASIDTLPSVEIDVNNGDDEHCVVCLEEWESGEKAKEMPCKHKFHGGCIEKWLKIHGSCPVWRYEMPVDDNEKKRREIWMDLGFSGSGRRTGEDESSDSLTSDQE